jgi:hypothetical protein
MAADERREHDRYRLWLPARIEGVAGDIRLAVGHDMSQKGCLLVTNRRIEVGTDITLTVRLPPDAEEEITLTAQILRCDENEADPEGLWPFQVAVEFAEADPKLEKTLRDHLQHLEGMAESGEQDA